MPPLPGGEIDLVPNMGITRERRDLYDFTIPLETFKIIVFVRSDSIDIRGLPDLNDRTIGVVEFNKGLFLMEQMGTGKLVVYKSLEEAFLALISGNVDSLVYPEPPVMELAGHAGLTGKIKVIGEPLLEIKRGIAVVKGRPRLYATMADNLDRMIGESEFRQIYSKWYSVVEEPFWSVRKVVGAAGFLVGFIVFVSTGWRYVTLSRINRELEKTVGELSSTQRLLGHSERKFLTAFRSSPYMMTISSLETGEYFDVNDAWINATGYTLDSAIGRSSTDLGFISRWSREMLAKLLVEKGRVKDLELELIRADGTTMICLYAGEIIEIEGEKRLLSIANDISERKAMEETIRQSAQKYHSLFEESNDGIFLHDRGGIIHELNSQSLEMLGYERGELEGQSIETLFGTEAYQEVANHLKHISGKGSAWFESAMRRKDGIQIPVEVSARLIDPASGIVQVIVRDITDRKKAFEEITRAHEKMRLAADAANFGVWSLDLLENRLEWDDWMFRLYGLSKDNFSGAYEAWQAGVHPEDLDRSTREVEQALKGEKEFDTRFRIVRPDGQVRHLKAHATVSRDGQGKPVHMIGVNYDITEAIEVNTALRESEERFKTLHNASLGGIAIHDRGVILECNRGLSEISGYDYNELKGMDVSSLISADDRGRITGRIESADLRVFQTEGVRKNGQVYPVRLEGRAIPYKGKNAGVVEFRDISEIKGAETENRELQKKFLQAQKMEAVGRLAGGVAHDFNNMLSLIIGYSEMVLEELDPKDPSYTQLQHIKKAGEHSADLTRQLLTFARKQTVSPKVIDINKVVGSMIKMLERLIGENIELSWQPGENVWPVKIDPGQIDQILANLCVNARHAISDVGNVWIKTSNIVVDEAFCFRNPEFFPGEYITLLVGDDGCGIDRETIENIFEPFFTTKESGQGTGLGLATVYGIVKQNEGVVSVQSEVGRGTTFGVYLPRFVIEGEEQSEAEDDYSPERGDETILLVEDDVTILNMTRHILQGLGYRVIAINNPKEAIISVQESGDEISLLLTDVVMPQMNGRQLSDELKKHCPDLKTLYMSGYTADVIADKGVLDEGIHFIEKPFQKRHFARKIREVLES